MASETPTQNDLQPTTTGGADTSAQTSDQKSTVFAGVRQTLTDEAGKLTQTGLEKAKSYAVDGKDRATGALDEFARLMTDAASSVDEKLGGQYGEYARTAANSLSSFSDTLRDKDVDDLLADARELIKKSPAVAIGTAAAVGFVLARLVKTGLDAADDSNRAGDSKRA